MTRIELCSSSGLGQAIRALLLWLTLLATQACSNAPRLMMTPVIYSGGSVDVDDLTAEDRKSTSIPIFYATDRRLDPEHARGPYPPERERFLRLGVAQVRIGPEDMTWHELSEESTSQRRASALGMHLEAFEDFGPLRRTIISFDPMAAEPALDVADRRFADEIDAALAPSRRSPIFVYVAPFKVSFELACKTAAEFHHYMGRDGAFVVYSWPTATGNLGYLSATENAYLTIRHLRILLEYLAAETDARQIHLMTFSAGARVLSGALQQLRLKHSDESDEEVRESLRIGRVVFIGPDIDAGAFLSHFEDGAADLARGVTVYITKRDRALRLTRWLYGWERLGSLDEKDLAPQTIRMLEETERVTFVSVTEAERSLVGNGHSYFRHSPWVSSDILLTLAAGPPPGERGLEREEGSAIWRFPLDYPGRVSSMIDRLRASSKLLEAE